MWVKKVNIALKFLKLTFLDLKTNCVNLIIKSVQNHPEMNLAVNAWHQAIDF